MSDASLQTLLDPDYYIRYRNDATGATISSYYCTGRTQGKSKAGWTDVTTSDSDANKATAIRSALTE